MTKGTKIQRLPDDIRHQLYGLLESKKFTAIEITEQINQMLADFDGDKDVESISKNTVWREAQRMDEIADQMLESQHWAERMSDKFDLTNLGEQGRLLLSMLNTAAFKTSAHLMSKEEFIDPDTLGDLVLSISRLQKGANYSAELEKQISERVRKQALEDAAKEMTNVAKERNLSPEDIVHIRERLYGIYDTPKALV
jgi:hypothetical protein